MNDRLLWVDCEMTGLDVKNDCIIEVAAIVTDGQLKMLDKGIRHVVRTSVRDLDQMGPWCQETHSKSGLIEECKQAQHSLAEVDTILSRYMDRYFPNGKAILAGSSVHQDRIFIEKDLPKTFSRLHYRIVDISTIKELANRWYPDWQKRPNRGPSLHRALDDIQDSIEDLRWIRRTLFLPTEQVKKEVP